MSSTTVTYPMSTSYVADWDMERAVAELIANALDADPKPSVTYSDGNVIISDRGDGLESSSLVIGDSNKNADNIGRFGEGAKLSLLVAARTGTPMAIETVGATLTPRIVTQSFGMTGEPSEVLAVDIITNRKRRGTKVTVRVDHDTYIAARQRFSHLTDRGYTPPVNHHRVRADQPGVIRIGGVKISERPDLCCGYDFTNRGAKHLLDRGRTTIDGWELSHLITQAIRHTRNIDAAVTIAAAILAGTIDRHETLRDVDEENRDIWRLARRRLLGNVNRTCWADSEHDSEAANARDRGWTVLDVVGERQQFITLMELFDIREAGQRRSAKERTTWVAQTTLDDTSKTNLQGVMRTARRKHGRDLVGKVRVFSSTTFCDGAVDGFYDAGCDTIGVHVNACRDLERLCTTLAHELAHKIAYRTGGEWQDRTVGFENALSTLAGHSLTPPRRRQS